MITPQERTGLSLLASRCSSDAAIVDAGTFLGSSTTALAHGLSKSGLSLEQQRGRIWCYDLFEATPGMNLETYGVEPGQSFRWLFDELTANFADKLRVLEGDIRQQPAPASPIDVLFIDIMWSAEAAFDIGKRFYPLLRPRRSVLIHQDFVYPFYPWIVINMGLMREFFAPAYNIPHSSWVFDVVKPVRQEDVIDTASVDYATGKEQFEVFFALADGWGKGALQLGLAIFAASRGHAEEARQLLGKVKRQYGDMPLVAQYYPATEGYLLRTSQSYADVPQPRGGG